MLPPESASALRNNARSLALSGPCRWQQKKRERENGRMSTRQCTDPSAMSSGTCFPVVGEFTRIPQHPRPA